MAVIIQGARQRLHVAELMAKGDGMLEASMTKAYVCRAAEWVTRRCRSTAGWATPGVPREPLLRRRPCSIFEGADETLALKVIIRRLLAQRTQ